MDLHWASLGFCSELAASGDSILGLASFCGGGTKGGDSKLTMFYDINGENGVNSAVSLTAVAIGRLACTLNAPAA